MSETIKIMLDGKRIEGRTGQSIIEAADEAGVYIPRLCYLKELSPFGSCRVCTVIVNGRPSAACTTPIAPGMIVQNDTEQLLQLRRDLIDMLFVEGNHYCMFCEKSGGCELQALAYRFGITAPRFPLLLPVRSVDASHPDVLIDHNRCVLCSRCVRASREIDGKHAFQFVGRGRDKRLGVNGRNGLGNTNVALEDEAVSVCPTGSILRKREGFTRPVGRRPFDHEPIGSEVEKNRDSADE